MSTIEESIDISVPLSVATHRWTQFEAFPNDAEATFVQLDQYRTRVIVQMVYEPRSLKEAAGDIVGTDDRRITDDLESFKHFSEQRAA